MQYGATKPLRNKPKKNIYTKLKKFKELKTTHKKIVVASPMRNMMPLSRYNIGNH